MKFKKIYIILAIIFIALLASYSYGQNYISNDERIHENIYIENVYIGNETKEEARIKILEKCSLPDINLTFEEKKFTLSKGDIDLEFKIDEILENAYKVGRSGSFIENIIEISKLKDGDKKVLKLEYTYDEKKLNEFLEMIAKDIDNKEVDATINIQNNKIIFTKDVVGHSVQIEELRKEIIELFELCEEENIVIPVELKYANITYDKIKNINTVLGQYETIFNPKVEGRTYNVRLASDKINERILMPGEEFSFNKSTGKRGSSAGYKLAPVIIGGELKESVGGGICQVSSTLYNAVLYSGLEITDRRNHSIPSSYTPIGLDATVSENSIDFKFKNNLNNSIYVYSNPIGNKMIVKIYGSSEDKKNIEVYSKVTSTIPRTNISKDDKNIEKGQVKISDPGRDGFRVNSYRVFIEQGERKEELLSKDYYPPKAKVTLRGIKEDSFVNSDEGKKTEE